MSKKNFLIYLGVVLFIIGLFPGSSAAADEFKYEVGYQDGFFLRSTDPNGPVLKIGGSIWAEYHWYDEQERADNRFDIRKARVRMSGQIVNWLQYYAEYEFKGDAARHMTDVYVEWVVSKPARLRGGQFKEPFSLEWQSPDRAIMFAERSMGYYLGPKRDVGLMALGGFNRDMVNFGLGVFNGNGEYGSTRGPTRDEPEFTGRIVIKPFAKTSINAIKQFQIGASGSTKKIDPSTINLTVKTTGMFGTSLNIYNLNANAKFGIIQTADLRQRYGLEGAWAWGPAAVSGEYIHLQYTGLNTSTGSPHNAIFSDWYVMGAWCITGEDISLSGGVINPVAPKKPFSISSRNFGGLAIAARADNFKGDPDWIRPYESVRWCDSYTGALNWFLLPQHKILLDYTYSRLSDEIKIRVNDDGSLDTITRENVVTLRYCLDF
jgi:phosphate-selective porin OprO/OprP